jgi:hypothetical protein
LRLALRCFGTVVAGKGEIADRGVKFEGGYLLTPHVVAGYRDIPPNFTPPLAIFRNFSAISAQFRATIACENCRVKARDFCNESDKKTRLIKRASFSPFVIIAASSFLPGDDSLSRRRFTLLTARKRTSIVSKAAFPRRALIAAVM